MLEAEAYERDSGSHEQPVGRLQRRLVGIPSCSRRGSAAVPDEDVEAAEPVDGRRNGSLEVAVLVDVSRDRNASEPRGMLLELTRAAGEEHDVGSLLGQRLGARESEARRGATDE